MISFSFPESKGGKVDCSIKINDTDEIQCCKDVAEQISPYFKQILNQNLSKRKTPKSTQTRKILKLKVSLPDIPSNFDNNIISNIFCGRKVVFTSENSSDILWFANKFQIKELEDQIKIFISYINSISENMKTNSIFESLCRYEDLFFELEKINADEISNHLHAIINEYNAPTIAKLALCHWRTRIEESELFVEVIQKINSNDNLFLKKFLFLLENEIIQNESSTDLYILRYLFDCSIITKDSLYFLRTDKQVPFFSDLGWRGTDEISHKRHNSRSFIKDNKNLKSPRKAKSSGAISSEKKEDLISNSLRNDDIIKFQSFASEFAFDLNGIVKKKLDEKYNFINNGCCYIEYAAFFGSLKCFKFLLLNQATLPEDLPMYAIAGGNAEIIHLCEHYKCNFNSNALKAAILFYQNDIFEWLINTKKVDYQKEEFVDCCIQHSSYKILSDLISNGVNASTIFEKAILNNISELIDFVDQMNYYPVVSNSTTNKKTLLHVACSMRNKFIVSKILKYKINLFDLNAISDEDLTALHIACKNGDANIVEILLQSEGLQINKNNKKGVLITSF